MPRSSISPDYSRIAGKYDRARQWTAIGPDEVIAELVSNRPDPKLNALEVGCGTGNYLKAQIEHGPNSVSWTGIDPSEDMLIEARSKLRGTHLAVGAAEALPFESDSFDYVICRASFHHFADKQLALAQLRRVIRVGGYLRVWGGHPEARRRWWVYRYFPETVAVDERRFWQADRMFEAVRGLGFEPEITTESRLRMVATDTVRHRARLRELSQLALIGDDEYAAGVDRLEREPADHILDERGILDLRARRLG